MRQLFIVWSLRRSPRLISTEAVPYIEAAQAGLRDISRILFDIRTTSLNAANSGVFDFDDLHMGQARIDNGLDAIQQIATHTQFGDRYLLDGSSGIFAQASNSNVRALHATQKVNPGQYNIQVDAPAERAAIEAKSAQASVLTQDETLTVNGVTIDLFAGMTQTQVRDRINEFSSQAGVVADITSLGKTRVYSMASVAEPCAPLILMPSYLLCLLYLRRQTTDVIS